MFEEPQFGGVWNHACDRSPKDHVVSLEASLFAHMTVRLNRLDSGASRGLHHDLGAEQIEEL
jgi:hypothetical protein